MATLSSEDEKRHSFGRALLIVIKAWGDNQSQAIQSCEKIKRTVEKLQSGYEGKAIVSKLTVLNALLNCMLRNDVDMSHHVLLMDPKFNKLIVIGRDSDESMKVAFFVISLSTNRIPPTGGLYEHD